MVEFLIGMATGAAALFIMLLIGGTRRRLKDWERREKRRWTN